MESFIGKVALNKNLWRLFMETNALNVSFVITSEPNGWEDWGLTSDQSLIECFSSVESNNTFN